MKNLFTQIEAREIWEFANGERGYFGQGSNKGLSDEAQDKLYEAFADIMPYGIQKARTGDPDVWIGEKFQSYGPDGTYAWLDERTLGGFNP